MTTLLELKDLHTFFKTKKGIVKAVNGVSYSVDEALKIALGLMPEGSSVTMGGSVSAAEIGLVDAVKNGTLATAGAVRGGLVDKIAQAIASA